MRRALLNVYVYLSYIVSLPLFVLLIIVMTVRSIVYNVRHGYGLSGMIDDAHAMASGMLEGHKLNKAKIDYLCEL